MKDKSTIGNYAAPVNSLPSKIEKLKLFGAKLVGGNKMIFCSGSIKNILDAKGL